MGECWIFARFSCSVSRESQSNRAALSDLFEFSRDFIIYHNYHQTKLHLQRRFRRSFFHTTGEKPYVRGGPEWMLARFPPRPLEPGGALLRGGRVRVDRDQQGALRARARCAEKPSPVRRHGFSRRKASERLHGRSSLGTNRSYCEQKGRDLDGVVPAAMLAFIFRFFSVSLLVFRSFRSFSRAPGSRECTSFLD